MVLRYTYSILGGVESSKLTVKIFLWIFLVAFLGCVSVGRVNAQSSIQLYGFNNVAQTTLLNPAAPVQANYTIGFYGFGDVQSPVTLADVFKRGVSLENSIGQIIGSGNIAKRNFALHANLGVFFGFKLAKKNYISLGVQATTDTRLRLSQSLLEVLWNGTQPYVGRSLSLGVQVYSNTYLTYHLGFARQINSKLTLGGRLKLLSGIQNIYTPHSTLSLTVQDGDPLTKYSYTLASNFEVRMNNYKALQNGSLDMMNFIFKNGINGFGVDIGAHYVINDKWTVSASVLDLGLMSWSDDVVRFHKRGTDINFRGINLGALSTISTGGGAGVNLIQNKIDETIRDLNIDTSYTSYTTRLQSSFYLGGEYRLTPTTKASATFYARTIYDMFSYAVGVSVSQQLWSIMDIRLGWSMYDNTFDNLGAGFSLNLYALQIYAMSENILSAFRYDQANLFNVRVGVNINIGLNRDRDKDGVIDKKDKCKKIPGLLIFDGCPDTDKDSVPDFRDSCRLDSGSVLNNGCPLDLDRDRDSVPNDLDSCPDIKGLKTANGCPDEDGDGVPDYQDSCKTVAGTDFANGCPDQDEDGIADYVDSCSSIAGSKEFSGCPTEELLRASRYDSDGDAVPDSTDACPTLKGSPLLGGCPDWDGDGVPDNQDSCFELPGELQFNGCPDTDGDKVPDYADACITLAGKIVYNGCPTISGIASRSRNGGTGVVGDDPTATLNQGVNDVINSIVLNPSQSRVLTEAFTNLEFAFQSATILNESYGSLDELADLLKSNPLSKVILIGHTDAIGSEYFNQMLSYKRANSVKEYLVSQGVSNKIETYGVGANSPISPNDTPEGRSRNRRVEIGIVNN